MLLSHQLILLTLSLSLQAKSPVIFKMTSHLQFVLLFLLTTTTSFTLVHTMEIKVYDNVAVLSGGEVAKFRQNHSQVSSETTAKRRARWTFQNLQEEGPVNGTEALQYDPITTAGEPLEVPAAFPPPPVNSEYRPDKVLKSNNDATVIMNQLSNLKKDFCKSDTIVQRIKEDGCIGRNVINRYCYGQCNSFYIPEGPKRPKRGRANRRSNNSKSRTTPYPDYLEDEDLTVAAFKSCPTCRPTKFAWITVTLRCPKLSPPYRKKRVQKIRQCKCMDGGM